MKPFVGKSVGRYFALLGGLFLLPPGCGPVIQDDEPIGTAVQALITTCPAGYNAIIGTSGNDTLDPSDFVGTPDPLLPYCILGHGGNDTITGSALGDYLVGGMGDDTIDGLGGDDRIWGESNNDTLTGGLGVDEIRGGLGNDNVFGGDGNETVLFGEGGDDTVNGDGGNDVVRGDDGMDIVNGGAGDDEVRGGADADTLSGGPGNDKLLGEGADDMLSGDDGDDILQGGTGIDDLSGGLGNDVMSENGEGGSSIGDEGNDVIVLSATADGAVGKDACTGANCELVEPPAFCINNSNCGSGKRCITQTKVCVACQSNSECPGAQCLPTLGCTSKELFCEDGIDNDMDGKVDCNDTIDCPPTLPHCEQGGVVDFNGFGQWHGCVRNDAGEVKCWGRRNTCQVGGAPQGTTPGLVKLPGPVSEVRSGSLHACALMGDGTVMCWGSRTLLGDGVSTTPPDCTGKPVLVSTLSGVTTIGAGGEHTCAVSGGKIFCWGRNDQGQLGNGTRTRAFSPVQVVGISTAVAVTAGGSHTCALLSNTTVRCWGRNHRGQLGNGSSVDFSTTPVVVTGLTNVTRVETGGSTACALLGNNKVRCWGDNSFGQLGNGTIGGIASTPGASILTGAKDIDVGTGHACSIHGNAVRCWGQNNRGQLGIGSTTNTGTPTGVGVSGINSVATGGSYTCARKSDNNTVYCWGANEYGQVSDTGTDVLSPQLKAGLP